MATHEHSAFAVLDGTVAAERQVPGNAERLSIKRTGLRESNAYTALVDAALDRALALEGKLSERVLQMEGMSGRNYRTFINNLIGTLPDARYLEIGSWAGSTACSAIDGNRVKAVCIDNWAEFGGPKELFHQNVQACLSDRVDFQFIESDFRIVDYSTIGTFNIYLFDGPHEQQDQYDGVALVQAALDSTFIFIVDDWNHPPVRTGTFAALEQVGLHVLYSVEIRTTQNDSHPQIARQQSDWHNGYFISVIEKRPR